MRRSPRCCRILAVQPRRWRLSRRRGRCWRRSSRRIPAVAEIRNDLARCYSQLGVVLSATGKPAEALESCEKARTIREALVLANPSLAAYKSDLAVTLGAIGALKQAAEQFSAAVGVYGRAIELLDGLASPDPEDYYNLACYHSRLAGIAGKAGSGLAADRGWRPDRSRDGLPPSRCRHGVSHAPAHGPRSRS